MDDGDAGLGIGKKNSSKSTVGAGEVDYRTKAGTAWSHNFLNQKPWHPLSYPNQRRKWIAEQTHANRERRSEEVAREFAQEQEFFRQTALFSKKEKEKVEMMKAVSFMYVRPPGYNAESAKAAEVAEERKKLDENNAGQDPTSTAPVTDTKPDKKARPKDVFGRPLPTEEEFEVLKNAPRLETGMPARVKPFGIEIRNVRCVRCGTFGHQSGDRECPLKDAIMPNEESRLKRDDPLTAILAQTDSSEPLKWELKQKPGMSPPRGGFQPDDPNQQIVAEEIFDEYGGFLSGGHIPALISNFSTKKSQKHSKHKNRRKQRSASATHNEPKRRSPSVSDTEDDRGRKREKNKHKKKKRCHSESSRSGSSDSERRRSRSSSYSEDRERKRWAKGKDKKKKRYHSETSRSDGPDLERRGYSSSSSSAESEEDRKRARRAKNKHKKNKRGYFESDRYYSSDSEHNVFQSFDSEDDRGRKKAERENKKTKRYLESGRPDGFDSERRRNRFSSDSEVDRERNRRAKGKHKEEDRCNSYRRDRGKRC